MSNNRKIRKIISLLITIVMMLGLLTSFAYGEDNQIISSKKELHDIAKQKIDPELMADLENEDAVEFLVYMKDQVDAEKVAQTARNTLSKTPANINLEVRKEVIKSLKDKADMTQKGLLNYIKQEKEKGNVIEYKPYYIVNMIYVKANKEVLENISYRAEVEKIYKNEVHTLDTSLEYTEVEPASIDVEWNVERIKADQVWDLGFDGTGVVVANLDSGVDWTHPALQSHWRGYNPETGETNPEGNWFDPVYNSTLPEDSDEHGTHVMGTIVGQEPDGSRKIGVAPGAKWIAARIFNTAGNTTDAIILEAAEWILEPGGDPALAPNVVNNSWGGSNGINDWFRNAVRNWRAAGIFPVFSAGNQRPGEPEPWPGSIVVPANYPESFAVAATDESNIRAFFSKLGPSPYDPQMIKPNISAPGVNVVSSVPDGRYARNSGTSMAAPAVSGVVALLLSANNTLSVEEIEEIITSTASPLTDDMYPQAPNFGYGYGLVNAFEAIYKVAEDIGTGFISGKVYMPGSDTGLPVINHEQTITEVFAGTDIKITANVSDDVAVTAVDLLIKNEGATDWISAPMERVLGDHKNGVYQITVDYDIIEGENVVYRIRAKDITDGESITPDYNIRVNFGFLPGEYEQGFEEYPEGWSFSGVWEWGEPSGVSPEPYEGRNVAGTVLDGYYPTAVQSILISPPFDLRDSSLEAATLRFYQWYDIDPFIDKGYVQISTDLGKTWKDIIPYISGANKTWHEVVIDLSSYIGYQKPILIQFKYYSYVSMRRAGWYIDNLRLVGVEHDAPETPADLSATPALRGAKLSWSHVPDKDLSYYNIYRSLQSDGGYELVGSSSTNSYYDKITDNFTTYYYKVSAVDMIGNESGLSEETSCSVVETPTLYQTDFEDDNGGFITGSTAGTPCIWEWGIPTSGPGKAASGEKLWATVLNGKYKRNTASYIESPSITIPEDKNPVLAFSHWIESNAGSISIYDYGQVLVSNDDGITWTNITPVNDGKYGGYICQWEEEEISLEQFKGDTIKIRFFFNATASTVYEGWFVDDVGVYLLDEEEDMERFNEVKTENLKSMDYDESIDGQIETDLDSSDKTTWSIVKDEEIRNIPLSIEGIPVTDGVVTVVETGRSVGVDPITGEYTMRVLLGDYTIRAEAYGCFPVEVQVTTVEDDTIYQDFLLDLKPTGTISGTVSDRYYGNPVENALVVVVEDPKIASVRTDENGYFEIDNVIIGDYSLKVVADSYETGTIDVNVKADEVTNVEIGLKKFVGMEEEIFYDDGTCESGLVLATAGHGLAVRFSPDKYTKILGTNIYFFDESFPTPGGNVIGIAVYGTDDEGKPYLVGEPMYTLVERGAWNYIDLSNYGFATDRDFYISTIQGKGGTECPGLGLDESYDGDRSYVNSEGVFENLKENGVKGALMIRAKVESGVLTPEITNLGELNYTPDDSITVEGTVQMDSLVNVFVNGEIAATQMTENKAFEIEVNLPQEENEIMVTAELNGVQTEPSPVVTVIKDKTFPVLEVASPQDNAKISTESIDVTGNVHDNRGISLLLINDVEIAINEDGSFYKKLVVDEGENIIRIEAVDLAGNRTAIERRVYVETETPVITNIEPSQDLELKAGDTLNISFNAPAGGEGYFRILVPAGTYMQNAQIGIPMAETSEGYYEGTWTVPGEAYATRLQVEVIYISEHGLEVTKLAPGRVTVISESGESMENLPVNTVIVGNEAYDINYLNTNSDAQIKLINYFNEGNEIYIKLSEDLILDLEGQIVGLDVLPDELTYYDADGEITRYVK